MNKDYSKSPYRKFRNWLLSKPDAYRHFWYYFLKLEIPNFIQIVTVVTIFGAFLDNLTLRILIDTAVSLILFDYLTTAFFSFIKKEISDPLSEFNRRELDTKILANKLNRYVFITILIFMLIISLLPYLIIPNTK